MPDLVSKHLSSAASTLETADPESTTFSFPSTPANETASRTLLDKIWDAHVIAPLGDGVDLLHVDRHLLHDLAGVLSLEDMAENGQHVARPDLTIATIDHAVSSAPGRHASTTAISERYVPAMRQLCANEHIDLYDLDDDEQGIIHVVASERGFSLPGLSIVCGDSHTCTHGALGALAWGIGSSEVTHVLATQTIRQRRPLAHRIWLDGVLTVGVDAKDVILHCIGTLGTAAGTGAAVEFAGSVVKAMSMSQRFVLCNMAIEMGAKYALIAPDDTTLDFLANQPYAPKDEAWREARTYWSSLFSDEQATFDREVRFDCSAIAPQITWGTSPEHVVRIDGVVPDAAVQSDPVRAEAFAAAQRYMNVQAGVVLQDIAIDWVFVGSCSGGYLHDLRSAARILKGRKVAPGVCMWVVPGSTAVKRAAEAEGLHEIFIAAGAHWRESACSLCSAANGETIPSGARCISTSNRNFVGRQGPGARTHLASPATAAASAILGHIGDARALEALP